MIWQNSEGYHGGIGGEKRPWGSLAVDAEGWRSEVLDCSLFSSVWGWGSWLCQVLDLLSGNMEEAGSPHTGPEASAACSLTVLPDVAAWIPYLPDTCFSGPPLSKIAASWKR